MDIQELILINSDKVRRDSNLMAFYIQSFFTVFGTRPNCAGCTFSSDWKKFVSSVKNGENLVTLNTKEIKMKNTFKLKKIQNKIFAYRIDKRTFRSYDNNFTDDFVKNFLTFGTSEEIEKRKELFSVLPQEEKAIESVLENETVESKEATIETPTAEEVIPVKKPRKKRTTKPKK